MSQRTIPTGPPRLAGAATLSHHATVLADDTVLTPEEKRARWERAREAVEAQDRARQRERRPERPGLLEEYAITVTWALTCMAVMAVVALGVTDTYLVGALSLLLGLPFLMR